jgi:Protein of unknown function (DUF4236)
MRKNKSVALRFRKSIKLAPGVRWNLSNSGFSWTLGPRGASVGIEKRGAFINVGIPSGSLIEVAASWTLIGTKWQ